MSDNLLPRPRSIQVRKNITIVASRYNHEFTDALVSNCQEELALLMPNAQVHVLRVPGAFEIPVTVSKILGNKAQKPDAVIALGLIIRGSTAHADLIAESITQSLQNLAVQHMVPVIHEVLLVADDKQAYARSIGKKLNRGREAARATTEMLDLFNNLL